MKRDPFFQQMNLFYKETHPDDERLHPHKRIWNICTNILGGPGTLEFNNVSSHTFQGHFRIAWMSHSSPIGIKVITPEDIYIADVYHVKPAKIHKNSFPISDVPSECNRLVNQLMGIDAFLKSLNE